MQLTVYQFEGTVDEIIQVQREMAHQGGGASLTVGSGISSSSHKANDVVSGENDQFVSERVAKLALSRRALSDPQKTVLRKLAQADRQWTYATELQRVTKYSRSQFAGLMGAFGRRVSHTKGYQEGSWFFDYQWDSAKECYKYRLPASVMAAVAKLDLASA